MQENRGQQESTVCGKVRSSGAVEPSMMESPLEMPRLGQALNPTVCQFSSILSQSEQLSPGCFSLLQRHTITYPPQWFSNCGGHDYSRGRLMPSHRWPKVISKHRHWHQDLKEQESALRKQHLKLTTRLGVHHNMRNCVEGDSIRKLRNTALSCGTEDFPAVFTFKQRVLRDNRSFTSNMDSQH